MTAASWSTEPMRARVSKAHRAPLAERAAGPQITWLQLIAGIKRITLGYTRNHRTHWPKGHVRVQGQINGGVKLYVYGDRGFTEIFVYCDDDQREAIRLAVEGTWPKP